NNYLIEQPPFKKYPEQWGQLKPHATQFLHYDDTPEWLMMDKDSLDDHYLSKRTLIKNRHIKRKPSKPPMEVMNEIVNSIYLKKK
ncbi:unnamed protein product, partial [Didymodactylos carnosus]